MKIAVSTESTADLSKKLIEENHIFIIPFNVILGTDEFKDDENLTQKKLYDFVNKTGALPKTSAIGDFDYENHFKKIYDEGYDAIIHIAFSSGLSSACANAERISKKFKNIYVIDSRSLSTGVGLLVMSVVDKINQGKKIEDIVSEVRMQVPYVQASFVIDNLKYLYKGGRCSSLALLGANILKIKPQIKLVNGKMIVGKKYRGKYEEVLEKYTNDTLKGNNPDLTRVFITSSSKVPYEKQMVDKCKEFGFKQVEVTSAGATICSHCGPDTIGILFINKD